MNTLRSKVRLSARSAIRPLIHVVRGEQVMLDVDLAALYGYSTKQFNRQVKNNIEKFDPDFMFQLTVEETANLRCKNCTSSWGGTRYLPHAFTEQGVYMLMTVRKIPVTIFTDNLGKGLHNDEYADFSAEYGPITLKKAGGIFHDRYVILDFNTPSEKIYHCGASSKDGGNRVMTIEEVTDSSLYHPLITRLTKNGGLMLKEVR